MIFLPFQSFTDSARALDVKRLGRMSLDVERILDRIAAQVYDRETEMWKGAERYLLRCAAMAEEEMVRRGYRFSKRYSDIIRRTAEFPTATPWWYQLLEVYRSHRHELARRDPEVYPLFLGEFRESRQKLAVIWPKRTRGEVV